MNACEFKIRGLFSFYMVKLLFNMFNSSNYKYRITFTIFDLNQQKAVYHYNRLHFFCYGHLILYICIVIEKIHCIIQYNCVRTQYFDLCQKNALIVKMELSKTPFIIMKRYLLKERIYKSNWNYDKIDKEDFPSLCRSYKCIWWGIMQIEDKIIIGNI